jgi:pimeloyl-ACP methyl ester carboxylesterase
MPKVKANNLILNYDQQGSGEPMILIPFLTADQACYAFQVPEYSKYFTCFSVDLRGTGESQSASGPYSTETLADDIAAFMQAANIPKAHITGLSLGAAVGMWLAAKYPEKVQSLSLHSSWIKTDGFLKAIVESWQATAKGLQSVAETTILAIFPWCFTPELYDERPDYIETLSTFVRSRPAQSVDAFLQQSDAVLRHDVSAQMNRITAPTQITFGSQDVLTSTRFAAEIQSNIPNSELVVFQGCAHAALYQDVQGFNHTTLEFLTRHSSQRTAA